MTIFVEFANKIVEWSAITGFLIFISIVMYKGLDMVNSIIAKKKDEKESKE